MSAWLLAAFLCVPASAQVFETGGAAAPVAPVPGAIGASLGAGSSLSPIAAVPGASVLAPSLNSAVLAAFPGQAAKGLPAGALRLAPAPAPALPAAAVSASAAANAGRSDQAPQSSPAPARRDVVPPSGAASVSAPRAVAADRRRGADEDAAPARSAARLDAAGREVAAPGADSGGLDLLSAEGSAELGRRLFDRVQDRPALTDGASGAAPGELIAEGLAPARDPLLPASAGGPDSGVDSLRDAVASPVPAAAAPGAAFSFFRLPGSLFARGTASPAPASSSSAGAAAAAPVSFERLTLELGSGLVVKVKTALGFTGASRALAAPGANAETRARGRAPASRAPITSTEWLERRGLLESLSVSEAAATQQAAGLAALEGPLPLDLGLAPAAAGARTAPARAVRSTAPAAPPARVPGFAWWALAFLPAGLVLLKELL